MSMHFCSICNRSFTRNSYLQTHLQSKSHLTREKLENKLNICECGKKYLHRQGLSIHKKKCTISQTEASSLTSFYEKKLEEKEMEKAELLRTNENMKKEIDDLKGKTGTKVFNNSIENQTNININYYGCENLEYITDKFIQEMMKIPYSSIPHIIKHIHFHPAHPENHNIKITNRKLPYASVFKNDKWELAHKRQTIEELMQKGYGLMDERLDNLDKLSDKGKERYQAFQNKFEQDDPEALKQIYQATEICLLNGNV